MVTTISHGGIMVRKNEADFLSEYAREIALKDDNYLCFEQDCDEQLVIRELLDRQLWEIPNYIADKNKAVEDMNSSVQGWHPEYWESRQKSLAAAGDKDKPKLADRLEAGKVKAAEYNAERPAVDAANKAKNAAEH